jgi:hypothetical protein
MPGLMMATERQTFDALNARLRADHRLGDLAGLADAYAEGAALYERQGDIDAACFFWTQAYVLALDAGRERLADQMHAKLAGFRRMG